MHFPINCDFRYFPEFQVIRNNTRILASNFAAFGKNRDLPFNHLFTLSEFRTAFSSCKDGADCPDEISFMLRKLHPSDFSFLLNLFF